MRARPASDEASATTIAFVVGLAVFLISTAVLASFALQPATTARPSDAILHARATDVLTVLAGTPGVPTNWGESASNIDAVKRPGLIEMGSQRTVDTRKLDSLYDVSYTGTAPSGSLSYDTVRNRLGLSDPVTGYHFHFSGAPAFPSTQFGTTGLTDYRVGYVGHLSGGSFTATATAERTAVAALGVTFTNTRKTSSVDGDVYGDNTGSGGDTRAFLVPRLNLSIAEVQVVSGTPNDVFTRMTSTQLASQSYPAAAEGTYAIALGQFAPALEIQYEASKDFRVVIGHADFSAVTGTARASFKEMVDGEGTNATRVADDYGTLDVSTDGGTTWTSMNPLSSTLPGEWPSISVMPGGVSPAAGAAKPTAWVRHTVDFARCTTCASAPDVLIALHWRADSDGTRGHGWFVDDFHVEDTAGGIMFKTGFEYSYYRSLVVGSAVDHNALVSSSVKAAIEDYVQGGGDLIVLAPDSTPNWLNDLFSAHPSFSSGQTSAPRASDPQASFLNQPNALNYASWSASSSAWQVSSTDFTNTVQGDSATSDFVIGVSKEDAFGSGSGRVIVTAYVLGSLATSDASAFLANAFTSGHDADLLVEFGPPVPTRTSVGSSVVTGVVDRSGLGDMVAYRMTLYLWQ